jgi:O-antigen/teichoic acid export membrane protein
VTRDLSAPELRRAALSGARWTAAERFAAESAAFASAIVLARLIPPAEFGRAAVALIVVALAAVLGTAGLTAPIVQRRELEREHLASAGFLGLALGSLGVAATAVFAVTAAPAVFGERTAELLLLVSPAWLLVGAGSTAQASLQRALRFRAQAGIEAIAVLASIGVSLGCAAAGLDGEALVLGAITLPGTIAVLSIATASPPVPLPTRDGVRDVWRAAVPVAGSSLAYLGYRNVDYAILGAQASAAQVGFYWRAYQLGVGYQSKISRVLLRVSFPIYSRAASTEQLREIRMRIVRAHATVLVPLLATFVGVAPVLVPWVFGATWEPTVVPAQIIAVAGMADAVVTGVGPLLVAVGRAHLLVRWNLALLAAYAVLIALLAPHGVRAVAIGVAAFGVAGVLAVQVVLLRPAVGLSLADLWTDVRAGVGTGLVVLGIVVALRRALVPLGLPDALLLAALGLAAATAYVLVLRFAFGSAWRDLTSIVRRSSSTVSTSPAG